MSLDFGNSSGSFISHLSQKTYLAVGAGLVVLIIVGAVAYALTGRPDGSPAQREAEATRVLQAAQNYLAHKPAPTSGVSDAERAAQLSRAAAAARNAAQKTP
jgi:hypothetical protein